MHSSEAKSGLITGDQWISRNSASMFNANGPRGKGRASVRETGRQAKTTAAQQKKCPEELAGKGVIEQVIPEDCQDETFGDERVYNLVAKGAVPALPGRKGRESQNPAVCRHTQFPVIPIRTDIRGANVKAFRYQIAGGLFCGKILAEEGVSNRRGIYIHKGARKKQVIGRFGCNCCLDKILKRRR